MRLSGPATAAESSEPISLQSLIWPDVDLCAEQDLYARLNADAVLSRQGSEIQFQPRGRACFDTYYNLFNLGKWVRNCKLKTLDLRLEGVGRFELAVTLVRPDGVRDCVVREVVTLPVQQPLTERLRMLHGLADLGILFFELRLLGKEGTLHQAHWHTADRPARIPDLMLSITTFRREAAVARTVERFEAFIAASPLCNHIRLTVVDNGRSADVIPSDHVTLVPNENLGGSGGFARGLLEAQNSGASHCLFMDDDAAVHMAAIERTWMFLAYAIDPATAVAGAVSHARDRWRLWENGAIFDHICRPQHGGLDLRDPDEVCRMEFDSTAAGPHNFYGGWWYFAFPVDQVTHLPFPYFVRGDDVSFSLVHDFNIVTLPGVISYQDEDFSVKETPLTVYLDLRSHLTHHLVLERMEIGRKGVVKIMLRFWLRSFLACHYDTLEAINLAQQDVLEGPEYFRANADLADRRKQIGALTVTERWTADEVALEEARANQRNWLSAHLFLTRALSKVTLNGHFLPGFRVIGNQIILPAALRGVRRPIWGAAAITYVSDDGKRHYTVRHDKVRGWRVSRRILGGCWRMWRGYDDVRQRWQDGYRNMTTREYWVDRLDVKDTAE